ncbi:uncharacterized protein EAE98_010057 [Botrytis deweyae]|uniref:Uncharacterized protein n=1 Tax=Botrytis deweyae TaxID=2478750 RepID=A0ABQ7I9K9_9HELO|nr:uncharacterized protein EAE98_010057 [Botrytis deweyae]KAF7917641.1 hypothetical protein EAE98_010057 [Botrytis deweyae]
MNCPETFYLSDLRNSTLPEFSILVSGLCMRKHFAHGENGYVNSNAAVNMLLRPGQQKGLATNRNNNIDSECGSLPISICMRIHLVISSYLPTILTNSGCRDVALAKALCEYCVNLTGSVPLPTITNLLHFLMAHKSTGFSQLSPCIMSCHARLVVFVNLSDREKYCRWPTQQNSPDSTTIS